MRGVGQGGCKFLKKGGGYQEGRGIKKEKGLIHLSALRNVVKGQYGSNRIVFHDFSVVSRL